jgi:subtilisin family serine protease
MYKTTLAIAVGVAMAGSVQAMPGPSNGANADLIDIQNRCIVRLNDDVQKSEVRGIARGMLSAANAKGQSGDIAYLYENSIKGFTVSMSCTAAEKAFGKHSNILSMEPDGLVSVNMGKPGGGGGSQPQQTPWSVTRVGGPVDGTGMTAWVLDTGIDSSHADLNVDTSRGFSAFTSGKDAGTEDGNGHGTHVAGTIGALDNDIDVVGVAAGTTLIPVKVLDSRGSGSLSGVIAGIDYVGANASPGECANMSLGGGFSQALNDAVEAAAQNSGAFFVVAAGNDGSHASGFSPASAEGNLVYTISAFDINDTMPSWSNFGNPPVDYSGPGVTILSTAAGGGTTTLSGTSMASPASCAVIMMTNGNPSTDGVVNGDQDGNPDPIIHL